MFSLVTLSGATTDREASREKLNNVIRTNHIKAKIDNTSQNDEFRLCEDRGETVNHVINECSKLA